jgi:NADH:ubiquinone oxidoreductase subunit 6 (subunit J)
MIKHQENQRQSIEVTLAALIILVAASLLIIYITPYGLATTPDSARYIEVAKNLQQGNGLVVNNYSLKPTEKYLPLTAWPPLYPILLSIFISPEKSDVFTASQLAIILLSISGWFIFLLLRRTTNNYYSLPRIPHNQP